MSNELKRHENLGSPKLLRWSGSGGVYLKFVRCEVAELLVGDRLDGRSVYGSRAVLHGQRKCILRHHSLACAGVCGNEHRMILQPIRLQFSSHAVVMQLQPTLLHYKRVT